MKFCQNNKYFATKIHIPRTFLHSKHFTNVLYCGSDSARILIDFGWLDPDWDLDEQNDLKKEKVRKCVVLKCWMFSFERSRLIL